MPLPAEIPAALGLSDAHRYARAANAELVGDRPGSAWNGGIRTVGDLGCVWNVRSEAIEAATLRVLAALAGEIGLPPRELVVLPAGIDLVGLLSLPFTTTTRHHLLRAFGYWKLTEGGLVTVGELVNRPGLDVMALVEIMCLTETALASGALPTNRPAARPILSRPRPPKQLVAPPAPAPQPPSPLPPPRPAPAPPLPPSPPLAPPPLPAPPVQATPVQATPVQAPPVQATPPPPVLSVQATPLAPWGSSPTPLLPRWYVKSLASTPLPLALIPRDARRTDATPRLRTVGDLPGYWSHRSTPLDNNLLRQLVDLLQNQRPPDHYVVLPARIPRSRLFECPFRTRTLRCLQRAFNMNRLEEEAPTTVGDLVVLPNFGIASLIDFMCVVEEALESRFLSLPTVPSTDVPRGGTTVSSPLDIGSIGHQSNEQLPSQPYAWDFTIPTLQKLLSASLEFRGTRTLGDALGADLPKLAATLGVSDELDDIPISELISGPSLAEEVLGAIAEIRESKSQSAAERLTIKHRIIASPLKSHVDIGREVDLSRERIRQLEKAIRAALESAIGDRLRVIAALIGEQLEPVIPKTDFEERILLAFSPGIASDDPEADLAVARRLLRDALGYSCTGGVCVNAEATAILDTLRRTARELADDAGLVDEHSLRACLPDEAWLPYWDVLVDRIPLHRFNSRLALRDTAKAKAKAALLQVGKPATKEELGELSGLAPDRVGAQMSVLSSIVRADKVRWGLAEWVDDEYEGIAAEIIQRINEDGGTTTLTRLLDELPRMFGVSESGVRASVATPAFRVEQGRVRLRREHEKYNYQNSNVRDAPGVFALSDGVVGLLYKTDRDVMRGSGRQLSLAAAALLGLSVDERLSFDGPLGTSVTVTFSGTSLSGPSLGSTRALAEVVNAKVEDMLTVILRRDDMTVSAQATDLNDHDSGWALVARLTGISENAGMDGLAAALHCSRGEVRPTLRARKDTVVLEALPKRGLTPDLEEALAALAAEMKREEP